MANQIKYQVGFDVNTQNLNQLKSSLQEIQKLKINDVMRINNTDFSTADKYLKGIKLQAENVESALKKAFNTKLGTVNIQQFNSALKNSGSSIDKVYEQFNHAGAAGQAAFKNLASSVLTTNIQLKETHTLLDKMATTLANTIKWNAASSVVNGFSRSVEQAWGYVKALDTSLNDIRIVTGKSSDEMAKFAVQANNAAKELGKTTTDYTNAALIYAQQGLSDEQIQARAAITLKAASVTGQSTDAVSEQLTAVWNGYKVTADEAQLYVDRLAAVAATTASNLQELSTGMSKVASAAAAMGVGQDQLAAQLSTIISVTRQAPESVGTALRTVYARISDIKAGIDEDGVTLGNYSGKMAELGFNVLDMNGNLRDMGEVMEEIGNKWESLTREQQISLAQTMAGQRQYSNLIALFDNFEKYNESLAVAQGAAGTLQKQQDIYMDQTAAHLQTLKASMEDIYDSLADTDSINKIIDALSGVATFAANLIDSLGGGIPILQSLGAIGLTVFSQQIGKGLNTTLNNFEIANRNARQFGQSLQSIQSGQWSGKIPALDSLLKQREQATELAKLMSPQQFNESQQSLNIINEKGNQLAKLQQQKEALDSLISTLDKGQNAWKNLDDVMKSTSAQNSLIKSFNEQEKELKESKIALQGYAKELKNLQQSSLKNEDVSGGLGNIKKKISEQVDKISNRLKDDPSVASQSEQIEKLKAELNTIDDNLPADQVISKLRLITGQLEGLTSGAAQASEKTRQALEREFAQTADSVVQQHKKTAQELQAEVLKEQSRLDNAARARTIKMFSDIAGGVAQVTSAIQQLSNIGSIWKNADLTSGEKLLQIVTNLAMSVPLLANGLGKLLAPIGLIKTAQFETIALANGQLVANNALAFSFGPVGIGASKAGLSIQFFNTTLTLSPMVGFIAILAALVAAFAAVQKAAEEARKASLENSQAIIQEQNSIQEQLNSHKELYNSLEETNQKYKDGEISRLQLKNTVEDLIGQYNLEDDAVNKLRNSYNNLSEAIEELRIKEAKYKKESSTLQFKDAENAIIQTAKGRGENWSGSSRTLNGQGYNLKFKGGTSGRDEPEAVKKELQNLGFIRYAGDYSFYMDQNDPEALANKYDQVSAAVERLNESLDASVRNNSELYLGMIQWLKDMKESVEEYREVQEQVAKYAVELDALTKEKNGELNFTQVDNATDYINQRLALIKQIRQKLLNERLDEGGPVDYTELTEKATKMADVYLQENFGNLHKQFDEVTRYVDSLQEKFGNVDNDVVEKLGKLSPQQLAFIEDIGLRDIQNWKDLASILEYMEKVDLSNLKVVTDPQGAFEDASSQYNLYSSLSDQISNNKNQTISKKEYEKLTPEVQEFFSLMANGQYKMTGDAKEFYDTVNNLSIEGFKKNIADLQGSNQRLNNLQKADFDKMFTSAATEKGDGTFSFVSGDVNQQLDFLTEMGYSLEKIVQWKAELADGHVTVGMLNDIAQACGDFANQTDKLSTYLKANEDAIYQNQLAIGRSATSFDTLKGYLDDGTISQKAFTQAAIELDASLDLQGLDTKQLEKYTDHLQQISTSSQALSDELKDNEQAAQIVAKGIMKMNDAVKKLSDNWDDWSDALKKNSKQSEAYANAMGETKETIADLLDISKDYVSDDFIQNHLDDISNAANGSQEAIDSLKNALAEDIIVDIMVQNGIDESEQANILSTVASLQAMIPDIEVGATIDDGEFLAKANQLIQDCGMTVDQANAMFDALGFEANFETRIEKVHQRVPRYITQTEVIKQGQTSDGHSLTTTATSTWQDGFDEFDGEMEVPAMATNKKTPVINSLTRKAGGGFSSGSSGGKSGSGGKGGGGGGSQNKPDTSKKEKKKLLKKTADPYHDVDRDLKKIDRSLQKLTKDQDKLFGKQYIDNLNKQNATLDKSIAKLKEKQKIQKQDLKNQRQTLKNLGFTFDKYGNITNYQQLLTAKQSEVNGLIAERNKLVQEYNKSTDKAFKQRQGAIIKQLDDRIKQGEDTIKQIEDAAKQYEDTQTAFGENNDAIEDAERRKIENNIKKFRYSIELRLDLGEATRDWNEFVRNVLQPTDVLRDNDFDELFADARQDFNDLRSYFGDGGFGGSIGTIEALTNQLKNDFSEINQINKTGWSDIYGKDKAQAMEHLKQDWEDLMQQMENVQQLIKNIDNAYLKMPDYMAEQFDKQIEAYDFINGLIQHDIDLLQILYGEESYAAMDKYYNKMMDNQNKQIDSLRKQADFWKQQRDAAIAAGQTNMAEKFEENYKRAIQNINSAIEDAANLLKDKYTNTINLIFDELNNKLTNGKGLDYLGQQWEYMQDAADEYLDTINAAYNLQTLQNKFQKAINNTEGLKNQKALKKLMDEQLENLKAREKLTQYDVDRAEKLLQVEQARIALEQAQSSKTSLRLKRDAQGNYSYQYVADEQGIEDAQQNYLDANNELTNFDMDRNRQNQNDMLAALREYQEKRSQIEIKYRDDDAKRIQQLALLEQAYQDKITGLLDQNLNIRKNLMDSAIQNYALLYGVNVDNYRKMSDDQRDILMNELVPEWDSGIQTMMNKIVEQGGFIPATQDAFEELHKATYDYEKELEQMAETAGISLDDVAQGTDNLTEEFSELVEENDQLINRMGTELDAIRDLKAEADALGQQYKEVTDAAKDMVTQIQQVIQNEYDQAASYQAAGHAYETMTSTIYNAAVNLQNNLNALFGGQQFGGDSGNNGNGTDGTSPGTRNNPSGINKPGKTSNQFSDSSYLPKYGAYVTRDIQVQFATGGYTGDWATDEGRVAMLDKKQLVLNQDDTKNFLNGISILRQIAGNFKGNLQAKMANIKSNFGLFNSSSNDTIEQNVKIEASFPNVNSRRQIEEAFNNLVNLAAQRAMRR